MNKKVFHTKEEKHRGPCDCGDCGKYAMVQAVKAGCGHKAYMCTNCFNAGKVIKMCYELCGGDEPTEKEDVYEEDDDYEDDDYDNPLEDDDDDDDDDLGW